MILLYITRFPFSELSITEKSFLVPKTFSLQNAKYLLLDLPLEELLKYNKFMGIHNPTPGMKNCSLWCSLSVFSRITFVVLSLSYRESPVLTVLIARLLNELSSQVYSRRNLPEKNLLSMVRLIFRLEYTNASIETTVKFSINDRTVTTSIKLIKMCAFLVCPPDKFCIFCDRALAMWGKRYCLGYELVWVMCKAFKLRELMNDRRHGSQPTWISLSIRRCVVGVFTFIVYRGGKENCFSNFTFALRLIFQLSLMWHHSCSTNFYFHPCLNMGAVFSSWATFRSLLSKSNTSSGNPMLLGRDYGFIGR